MRQNKNQPTVLEGNILRAHRRRVMACHGVLDGSFLDPDQIYEVIDNYLAGCINALTGSGCNKSESVAIMRGSLARLEKKLRE